MKRILATGKFIDLPKNQFEEFLVLTPNAAAAGRLNVPRRSLRRVAEDILNRASIGVASPLKAAHVLKEVLANIEPARNPAAETARLRPILETVLRDGIDIVAMKRSGLPRAERLADIVTAYKRDLSKDWLIDAEEVLWKAGELITEPRKILVYGYFRARMSDIRFIDKLAGDGSVFVVPTGTESIFRSANRSIEWLAGQGWERADHRMADETSLHQIASAFASGIGDSEATPRINCKAFVFPTVEAEVRATLAAAKQMVVEGTAPDRIAVVCRNASDYEKTIAAIADEYGLPLHSQSKAALSQTKLGTYIALVLEAVAADLEFSVTARLLSHLYGQGLNEKLWTTARKRRISGAAGWGEAGIDVGCFAAPENQTLEKWLAWLFNIAPLSLIRERAAANAVELIAYERFCEAAEELRMLGESSEIGFEVFSEMITEMLLVINTPIDPGTGGVQLHQPDTLIGGEFDHVFVIGMAEGMLPAPTNEDAVIDFYDQRRLEERGVNFDRPAEFPRWEALSFYYVLLAASGGITFSHPKTIGIDEKISSPFFERLGLKPMAVDPFAVASPQEQLRVFLRKKNAAVDHELLFAVRHSLDVERGRESSQIGDEYDGVIGIAVRPESRVWSASQLTKIGQCPFKWFAEKILRLFPTEEADTDLRSNVLGKLYHRTLQIAVGKALNAENFREAVLLNLEPAFYEAEADKGIGVGDLPNWQHRRAEHLTILKKAVEAPDFIAAGSHVVATEQEFQVNWNGFGMRGSIDRVDETPEGFKAIDYKTGTYVGKVKGESGELETDVQLPIYSKVALESMFPGRVGEGHYFSLRQTKIIRKKPADLERFAGVVKGILEAGAFAVDPDRSRKSCKYCEYDVVCRQGQRNSRKRI